MNTIDQTKKGLGLENSQTLKNGNNHLFVIAIDDYRYCPKLSNCVKDTTDFIDLLSTKYQFTQYKMMHRNIKRNTHTHTYIQSG